MSKIRLPGMPAPLELPYLKIYRSRGRDYCYFRKQGQPQIRMYLAAPDFMTRYEALCKDEPTIDRDAKPGTVAELVERFLASPDFLQCRPKTREEYKRHLDYLRKVAGARKAQVMPRAFVLTLRDTMSATPTTANQFAKAVRRVYSWGIDYGFATVNPALKIKRLREGPGHRPWEEFEIKAFRKCHKLGTLKRTAMELTLGSVQRGSDVILMQRQHILKGWLAVIAQKKTGNRVEIPLLKETRNALTTWLKTHKHMMILVQPSGRPLTKFSFSKMMREAYTEAALDDVTTHGLRYTGARRHQEAGSDMEVIGDIVGHTTVEQTRQYAGKRRQTSIAVTRLERALKAKEKGKPDNDG